eukprot:GILJ01006418.1.p1 GENE.GILJ01006418.1~~GILJ01006418.1.p1  ORF type:complete len:254 (-),score=19.35 GILJ01006418.1:49-810(-)
MARLVHPSPFQPLDKVLTIAEGCNVLVREQSCFQAGVEGYHLWESSLLLARWVYQNKQLWSGKRVAELGSGCGLAGLCLCKFTDCQSVLLTDYQAQTLSNLRHNLNVNFGDDYCVAHHNATKGSCRLCSTNCNVVELDWREDSSLPQVDVVFGSDLVYAGTPVQALCDTIDRLLSPTGVAHIVLPDSRQNVNEFLALIAQKGFQVERESMNSPLYKACPYAAEQQAQFEIDFPDMHNSFSLYTLTRTPTATIH